MASALCDILMLLLLCGCAAALATSPDQLAATPQPASAATPSQQHNLHLHLSLDELKSVFSVERHADVPEYDLFHVRSVRKRSTSGRHRRSVHVRAFDSDIDLDLHMNNEIDNNIRMFYADMPSDDLIIERVEGDTDMFVGDLYQDVEQQAALLVDHADDDTLRLNGVVEDLVIVPVPQRVHGQFPATAEDDHLMLLEEMRSQQEPEARADNATAGLRVRRSTPSVTRGLHVLYRRRSDQPGSAGSEPLTHDDTQLLEEEPAAESQRHNQRATGEPGSADDAQLLEEEPAADSHRHKRAAPADLYPEVLVIVDYETYAAHRFNAKALKRYMMSFMNAVDLRYKSVSSPSITIKVAGIVISKSKKATPYLESHMVDSKSVSAVDALASLGKFLFTERRMPSYDIAMVITKRDMCSRQGRWGNCNRITAGYAYVGGGCSISKYYNKINSVALIEDSTGFSGIIVATHELGHLLGAVHDGSPPANYLGGPGARSCPWKDGYIMSDLRRDYKGLQWSTCSIDQFAHFASNKRSRCMQNYPSNRSDLPTNKALPGKMMTVDAQCKRDRGSKACFKDHRVCAELYCYEASSGYCVSYRPAAEGSSCGRGMHCINGLCIPGGFNY